jgi:hypothetical protein
LNCFGIQGFATGFATCELPSCLLSASHWSIVTLLDFSSLWWFHSWFFSHNTSFPARSTWFILYFLFISHVTPTFISNYPESSHDRRFR